MTYTTLRVSARGVVLYAGHRARFAHDPAALEAFERFARGASEGIYALHFRAGALEVRPRARSRLVAGIALRALVSPVADRAGALAKPAPPCAYDAVRADGVATLLTDRAGREVYEACTAAVWAWDGAAWVAPPEDRPRVASVTEAFAASVLAHRRAPIALEARWPVVLLNAVAGVCAPAGAASALPAEARAALVTLSAAIEDSAGR